MKYTLRTIKLLNENSDPLNHALNIMLSHYLTRIIPDIAHCSLESNVSLILLLSSIIEFSNRADYCLKLIEDNLKAVKEKQTKIPMAKTYALFGGFTDLSLCLHAIACYDKQWNINDMKANTRMAENVMEFIDYLETSSLPLLPNIYDCISGLSGTLGYFLLYDNKTSIMASKRILSFLIKLSFSPNAWHIAPRYIFSSSEGIRSCDSIVPLGLAHGVASVLAALSLAEKKGISVVGQREAMESICNEYLLGSLRNEKDILYWPSLLSYDSANRELFRTPIHKMSWCHGSLGILRALQLYAQSMSRTSLENWVINCFNIIANTGFEELNLDSPTFCHGVAGLLTTLRTVNYGKRDSIPCERLTFYEEKLIGAYDPKSKYGFYNVDYIRNSANTVIKVNKTDDSTLLTGAPGIIMALLSRKKQNFYFERHFLLG